MSDYTPTTLGTTGLPPGFAASGSTVIPKLPDVYSNIIPYLESKGMNKAAMPTGFNSLKQVTDVVDGQSKNYLRVYFNMGTKSSLITVKISTAIADTIVWNPQVADFKITSFPDFGQVVDIKSSSITVQCVAGSGSARIDFTKSANAPISITPALYTPALSAGESYTYNFNIQNLGTPTDTDFSITASVSNVLGTVTDTATAYGTAMAKTGATTIVHVITEDGSKPISNLAVTIEYAGTSQTKTTGLDGLGTATFNLGTSSTVSVKACFAGNVLYKPVSATATVSGGTEKTIRLALVKDIAPPTSSDWTLVILALALGGIGLATVYMFTKRKSR